ncbi:2-polyprenyl-6-methoxyphenol hydroxylase-like FAD-dependent oxidoreductase [Streptomyces sp. V4I23]|uniref:NAD(P)/FAD-dependent oxidoreductase n=1 Tax=Streptomyces sp. V4I23 TaxID=3042282 RepID=UPI00278B3DB7|nr:FAD-dependent oxidoreductase [Streptomyces sp. V4I23]MDQ1005675.1 2-polyprenyl-6-methoxyphenol hydroxylase-like FAD-dependent oxidoreductase [Streptomyces sp. V4I23]
MKKAMKDKAIRGGMESNSPLGRAVIIGAGMSGLLAARVLSDRFASVTILERDRFSNERTFRPGVPQARHLHTLIARGFKAFEEIFPGTHAGLSRAGARIVDFGADGSFLFANGWASRDKLGVRFQPAGRTLLEGSLREVVSELPGVRILDGSSVTGLYGSTENITGVTVRTGEEEPTVLEADLVIDASGRRSHLPDWLEAVGLPRPKEHILDAGIGYASRLYENKSDEWPDWHMHVEFLQHPEVRRGCYVTRIEENRLIVTLQGIGGDHPPNDEEGFSAFLKSLRSPIADFIESMQAVSPIYRYAATANRRLDYHRISPWPSGLIVVGDSACTFNPVYAQGMTVAALEAQLLRDMIDDCSTMRDLRGLPRRFQRRSARLTRWPWTMSTAGDWAWQQDRKPPPMAAFAQWYMSRWLRLVAADPWMFKHFARALHMLSGPGALVHPRLVFGIVRSMFSSRATARLHEREGASTPR